ncbi:hypothetical protein AB0I94_04280 [Streptomyces sp. NPDC050147]|uniref:hypothetical protein n=1 Tax=Streptomyces sp. NPDC050147 TaxID=3155513 RepID=UPI00343D656A
MTHLLLVAAPEARVVTTFTGAGIMSCERPLPLDRVFLLNPGQTLDVGDRTLTGFRPPLFDNPATVGFLDGKSGVCFSSDCFGGPMPSADLAQADDVRRSPWRTCGTGRPSSSSPRICRRPSESPGR